MRPVLHRFDLHVEVPPVDHGRVMEKRGDETSAALRARVLAARAIQENRFPGRNVLTTATMGPREVEKFCHLAAEGENLLRTAIREYGLSARVYGRIFKVARTIADLAESLDRNGSPPQGGPVSSCRYPGGGHVDII